MPPVWVQLRALVEVHATVKLCPARTELGVKEIAAVGAGAGLTVNVIGADVTLRPFSASTVQVTVMTYVPDCGGAAVSVPWGSGVVPNGVLLSNGGRELAGKGRLGFEAIAQVERFEFQLTVA